MYTIDELLPLKFETFESVKNSNVTRWNSTLKIILSIIPNFTAINVALIRVDCHELVMREEEMKTIKGFHDFLKIFEQCTVTLQGQEYPTLSLSILFLEKILNRYFCKKYIISKISQLMCFILKL